MLNKDYLQTNNRDLQAREKIGLAFSNENIATLGITKTIITNLTTLKTALATDLNNATAKQVEAKAATKKKNISKTNTIKEVRVNVKQIQAKPGVPDNLKAQLGITVPGSQPAPQVPLPPAELTALAESNGTNTLKWNRSGNPSNTVFVIECRHAVNLPWQIAGTTTKTTFEHQNQVPGFTLFYQVKAQRNQLLSPPSNEAVVYVEGVAPAAVV